MPSDAGLTLRSAYEALCARYGVRPPDGAGLIQGRAGSVDDARALLPADAIERASARGAAMSLDETLGMVLEILRNAPAGPPGASTAVLRP